jgi:glycerol-3-phosphate dehydrogenase subunit C
MTFSPLDPLFWDEADLDQEIHRIFDICHGCRLCFNLCPSFPKLFERVDSHGEAEVKGLTKAEIREVIDLCYECKLCFPKCPYVPPHEFMLDFPRLVLRAKAINAKKEGIPFQDKMIGNPDFIGRMGSATAPVFNRANKTKLGRVVMEKTVGIHRDWPLPVYQGEPFSEWFKKHKSPAGLGANGKVAFFTTCSVEWSEVETGIAAVQLLEHNCVGVIQGYETCCGMPYLDVGDIAAATENARKNVARLAPAVREGYAVVSPGPTCSYMLKEEYPLLLDSEDARLVAANTYDLCQYLMKLHADGKLNTQFPKKPGKIAYHLPCHLKAQNIGYKSRDLLQLTGARVQLIDQCSCVDGTWGMTAKYHDLSLKWADKLMKSIDKAKPELVASDCPLASLRILEGTGKKAVHPVIILRDAYGL